MLDLSAVDAFLAQERIALVGASPDPKRFGNTIYRELRRRGYDVVAVNPNASEVDGAPCYPDLASVPGELGGVLVMVRHGAAAVVRDAVARGVPRVWLFRGAGPGALSAASLAACEEAGVEVVAGACPLMFLDPVRGVHRLHRGIRRLRGDLRGSSLP